MNAAEATALAYEFRVLADPTRVRIVAAATEAAPDPVTVSALVDELGLAQSTVSHHVRVLLDAGFLQLERVGTWSYYRAVPERMRAIAKQLEPKS